MIMNPDLVLDFTDILTIIITNERQHRRVCMGVYVKETRQQLGPFSSRFPGTFIPLWWEFRPRLRLSSPMRLPHLCSPESRFLTSWPPGHIQHGPGQFLSGSCGVNSGSDSRAAYKSQVNNNALVPIPYCCYSNSSFRLAREGLLKATWKQELTSTVAFHSVKWNYKWIKKVWSLFMNWEES